MPRWTPEQYAAYQARLAPSSAKPEQTICDEPMAKKKREERYPDRVRVSIVSFRTRLCDPDNLCPKYFVDCLRYAGLICNDRPQDITLEVSQIKVKTKTEERTEIELTRTNS